MMSLKVRKSYGLLALLALVVPILAACGGAPAAQPVRETVVVVQTAPPQVVRETVVQTVTGPTAAASEPYTTPHPIIGYTDNGLKVRQAIAYCTDRTELIKSVYPFLNEDQQKQLLMDTNIPATHWAHTADGITTYPFDVEKGKTLLTEAGWTVAADAAPGTLRENAAGEPLTLRFTTTNAQFRITWATVLENQLKNNCGIQILRTHVPGSIWFGSTSGLRRRDFELGAYAWVGQADPSGQTLYACNQIPLASTNWNGQNYMGWCNDTASKAIVAANNTLTREDRKKQYVTFQQEFTKDMISLPLFQRAEAIGWSKNLQNLKADPTDYYTAGASDWALTQGDTVVMAFTQEPATMNSLTESAAVQSTANYLIAPPVVTSYTYDYQPNMVKSVPTIESGATKNNEIDVKEGDDVWTTAGERAKLADGVEVVDAAGETVTYKAGSGTIKMKQLVTTYEYADGLKWSDGEPMKKADFELSYKHGCDRESGSVSYTTCDSIQKIDFTGDLVHTVTYLPGNQSPTYFLPVFGAGAYSPIPIYPSHQVIETEGQYKGKKLGDVPAKDWATLKEIAETPLSYGPYVLKSWEKGQRMTFEANPNYFKGAPKVKSIIIQIVSDTNQAVAQLLTGNVDVVGTETLGAGPEVETVLKAAGENKINAEVVTSPTWEHIDFNLFAK
jgi:ABC-type transport system substrate-binding protein